jgi:hypothetical protein
MKILLTFICFISTAFAQTAHYDVKEGKLHKGGRLSVEVVNRTEMFRVKVKYAIDKRGWPPVPSDDLRGESIIDLPVAFADERGYLELESKLEMKLPEANLKFVKKEGSSFVVDVLPYNGKSSIRITYHSELPAAGWKRVVITFISKVPLLNGHQIRAELN